MKTIDLNADIGEANTPEWAASEAAIVSAISSANIACGGHAGDAETMRLTVRNAKAAGVTIGAHPAYPDRENFGRRSFVLGQDIEAKALAETLREQIQSGFDYISYRKSKPRSYLSWWTQFRNGTSRSR